MKNKLSLIRTEEYMSGNARGSKNKGFVLITTLILSIVFFIICATFAAIVKQDVARSRDIKYAAIAYYVSEAGIQYVKGEICKGNITGMNVSPVVLYNYGGLTGNFRVTIENYTSPSAINYNVEGNIYRYLYTVESVASLRKGNLLLAQKSIRAEIATVNTIQAGRQTAGYIYREYERYR